MKFNNKVMVIVLFIMLLFSIAYGENSDTFVVLLEDGSIEERPIENETTKNMFYSTRSVLNVSDQIKAIEAEVNVRAVSLNGPVYLAEIPSDLNINDAWRFEVIHMNDLWTEISDNTWIGTDVVVAVVDTGIKPGHQDINIIPGINVTGGDLSDTSDDSGHGTHVSGIIGAKRNNGSDFVVGIAPNVKIMPIKVFRNNVVTTIAILAEGLRGAIDAEVDVINMSLSYTLISPVIESLILEAESKGIVVVAASSNESNLWLENETYDEDNAADTEISDRIKIVQAYPSAYPTVIGVGSVAYDPVLKVGISDFSNVSGIRDGLERKLDVVAPGSSIYSSHYMDETKASSMSGTSMAAPHVSGMAALLVKKYPELSPESIREIIRDTADYTLVNTPDVYNKKDLIGHGLINIEKALNFKPLIQLKIENTPDFIYQPSILAYEIHVDKSVENITFNEIEIIGSSTLTVNGILLSTDTYTVPLSTGINLFEFKASLGSVENTYTISVIKGVFELESLEIYGDELLLTTDFDINLNNQVLWLSGSITNIKIKATVNPGLNFTIDDELVNEKTFVLSTDPTAVIKVYDSLDNTRFKTYTLKFINDNEDIFLDSFYVNDLLYDSLSATQDLGVLPYGPMIFKALPTESTSSLSYSLNGGNFIDVTSGETWSLDTAFDVVQTLRIKVASSTLRYKWYTFTFVRNDGTQMSSFKISFYDDADNLLSEHTKLEAIEFPYTSTYSVFQVVSDYDLALMDYKVDNDIVKTFSDSQRIDLLNHDYNVLIGLYNASNGQTRTTYNFALKRSLDFNFDLSLTPKNIEVLSFYEDFNFDISQSTYDLRVDSSTSSLQLDLTGVDSRLEQSIKVGDGNYSSFIASTNVLNLSSNNETIKLKLSYGSQGDADYKEVIYTINLTFVEENTLGDVQVTPPIVTPPAPVGPAPMMLLPPLKIDEIDQAIVGGEEVVQVVVSLDRIKNEKDVIVVKGEEAVLFDIDVINYLKANDKVVEVNFKELSFELKADDLAQFSKETLTFKFKAMKNKAIGDYFEMAMFAGEQKVKRLEKPIAMTFKTDNKLETNFTGVYYYNEDKSQWVFVGGLLKGQGITFDVRHFSKYKVIEQFKTFEDVKNHWGKTNIEALASRNIIKGVSITAFSPDTTLTVAEFIALTARGLDLPVTDKASSYKKLSKDNWYYQVIKDAEATELIASTFALETDFDRPILREEMTGVLASAYAYINKESLRTPSNDLNGLTKDAAEIHPMFKSSVSLSYEMAWIKGDDRGYFKPKDTATRAEAAAVIERLLKTLKFM